MTDLFSHAAQKDSSFQPLAERMRPRTLDEVIGQDKVLAPGRALRRLIAGGRIPSLILWGPPGTGKTTIARLLAQHLEADFESLSAVMDGVKDLRRVMAAAKERRGFRGRHTVLFVDEIHRFNKAQQDALLPSVESGVVTLIGATTENPSFEINAALLSRCRVFVLELLSDAALEKLLRRALDDPERGVGRRSLAISDDTISRIAASSDGDARRALSVLEVAVGLAEGDESGELSDALVQEAMQRRTLLYDKQGDEHYGVISAFIKSMRGSDPDAAVYWLVRMLEAGEDPRFLLRRMVIFASEDVGNADPQALSVATAALASFELVGLPEGVLPLTQAVTYLACAPKSNAALKAYGAARRAVLEHGPLPVPAKLKNATSGLTKMLGHGKNYKYPHNYDGNYVPEDYLPEALVGSTFFEPSDSGAEAALREHLASLRADKEPTKGS